MDNKKVIDRNVEIKENSVVITEQLQSEMDLFQLQQLSQQLRMRKAGLKEQNKKIIEVYNDITQQEIEIENIITRLNQDEKLEKIE